MSLTSEQKFDMLDTKLDMIGFDVASGKLPDTLGQSIYEGKCVVQIGGTEPTNTNFEMFIDRDENFGIAIDETGNPDGRVQEVFTQEEGFNEALPRLFKEYCNKTGYEV